MRRDSGIPLYYQLETILRQKISSGELAPGQPLPSEDALAAEYSVSRITVRQALALLDRDGLINRRRGQGTFVAKEIKKAVSPKYSGSIEELISVGIKTQVKVLSMERIEAPARIRKRLELEPGRRVLMLEKIRLVEDRPLSYGLNYLPEYIGRQVENADLNKRPLLMILERDFGLLAEQAIQSVEASVADARVADLLDIRVGDPLLRADRTVYDQQSRPLMYVSVFYRADRYTLSMRLKRVRSENSAGWQANF